MTTTDTALITAMVQAIYDAIPWDGMEPIPLDDMAAKDWMERDAAAILPIVRAAQAEAWEQGFLRAHALHAEHDERRGRHTPAIPITNPYADQIDQEAIR